MTNLDLSILAALKEILHVLTDIRVLLEAMNHNGHLSHVIDSLCPGCQAKRLNDSRFNG